MKRALVLVALLVGLGVAASAQITGSWCTSIAINPQTPAFKSFNSTLIVNYTVGGWTLTSTSGFTLAGWATQEFTANGTLGAFTFASDLVFDPAAATFTDWTVDGSVSIAGVKFDGTMYTDGTGMGWMFSASGAAGDLTALVQAGFNLDEDGALIREDYCLCYDWIEFTFTFPFCCLDKVTAEVSFSRIGFEDVEFSVTGIPVPSISWLTIDAFLRFGVGVDEDGAGTEPLWGDKALSLTPRVNFPAGCITFYTSLVYSGGGLTGQAPLVLSGLEFDGLKLSCTFGAVTFSDYSSLNPAKNKTITGDAAYWEKICIGTSADSCCGGAFKFNVCLWFSTTSTQLFDLGKTSISLSYGLGSNLTITSGLVVLSTAVTEWDVGFCVTW